MLEINSQRLKQIVETIDDATLERFVDDVFRHPGQVKQKYGISGLLAIDRLAHLGDFFNAVSSKSKKMCTDCISIIASDAPSICKKLAASEIGKHFFEDIKGKKNLQQQIATIASRVLALFDDSPEGTPYTGGIDGAKEILAILIMYLSIAEAMETAISVDEAPVWNNKLRRSFEQVAPGPCTFLVSPWKDGKMDDIDICVVINKDNAQEYGPNCFAIARIPVGADFIVMNPDLNILKSECLNDTLLQIYYAAAGNILWHSENDGLLYGLQIDAHTLRLYPYETFMQACGSDIKGRVLLRTQKSIDTAFCFKDVPVNSRASILKTVQDEDAALIIYDYKNDRAFRYEADELKNADISIWDK